MKTIEIPTILGNVLPSSLDGVAEFLDDIEVSFEKANIINWNNFPYLPEFLFRMAHFKDGLFLQFRVAEDNVKATVTEDNGPVYNDSCVEFFLDTLGNGFYYNFEFNCIGTLLLGYGAGRHNRIMAPMNVLEQVKRQTTLEKLPLDITSPNSKWELKVVIPFTALFEDKITGLKGLKPRCNIYKCGNLLKVPHYVSWSPILSEQPDFHRPECFGNIIF